MKKWYAVLGNPIHHSISPKMHDLWFQQNAIDASYIPIFVERDKLQETVVSLALLGCSGFNVTVPFKEEIIAYLDELDASAALAGAVNTVVRRDGKWVGYNTDGLGLLANIPNLSHDSRVLLVGAGGAARGIVAALSQKGIKDVTITNRTSEKASRLAQEFEVNEMNLSEVSAIFSTFDVVIQTTSVGMDSLETPLSNPNWTSSMLAVDIIYSPPETVFLKQARQQGATTMNGLSMLIGQGALAFELWTGIQPDQQEIRKTIFRHEGEQPC
ncbi:shikimate dehydrogenase [Chryseomicrobium excrementi]|uniref:Shikimate dehydrogenase (NADP(+)) n=1 Tax=Chryseomicrobium excrementi TaxID=2041346 RepID=A0A2M9F241_9BACL|nr:shikimate dehydrogenase [Chryseomicrobium excrementi]PJK17527.1 shikimate dehydrogenase [Chryseomicrobium excrementi]